MYVIILCETKQEGFAKKIAKKTSKGASNVVDKTADVTDKVADTTVNVADKVADTTVNVADQVADTTVDNWNTVKDVTTEITGDVVGVVTGIFGDSLEQLLQAVNSLNDTFNSVDSNAFSVNAESGNYQTNMSNNILNSTI